MCGGLLDRWAHQDTTLNTAIKLLSDDGNAGDFGGSGDVADGFHGKGNCKTHKIIDS